MKSKAVIFDTNIYRGLAAKCKNDDGTFRQFELYENISAFIQTYENARKEKKAKKTNLEKFAGEEESGIKGIEGA